MLKKQEYLLLIPGLAFAAMLIAGFVVSLTSLKNVPGKDWAELAAPESVLSGQSTQRFTKLLNQHFVLAKSFSQIEHGILWNLTGDLGARVRAGCDDWLFLSDELEVHAARAQSAEFRVQLAAQLERRLAERGIKLLMVVVPDKTRIESAHLCTLQRTALFQDRINHWLNMLPPVTSLNLTALLDGTPGDRYYHTDTHWNENGANASAAEIARELGKLGWVDTSNSTAVVLSDKRVERSGDLVHLAGLDGLPGFLRPKLEPVQVTEVAPVAVASDDLFGDAGLPTVALVGTSYSRNANFVPFLEHHLGEPVANLAKDGGDFFGAAADFFGGETFQHNPPKVVLWEIPERVIEMPVTETERQWLEKLNKSKL